MAIFCTMSGYAAPIGASQIGMVSTATAKAAVSIRSCCGVDDFMSGLHDALAAQQAARAHEQDDHVDPIADDLVDAGDDALDLVHRHDALQDATQKARAHPAGHHAHTPPE